MPAQVPLAWGVSHALDEGSCQLSILGHGKGLEAEEEEEKGGSEGECWLAGSKQHWLQLSPI